MDLLKPRPRIDAAVSARIGTWAREALSLPDDAGVLVTELRCTEPGCPPIETVVVISGPAFETFQRKLHKPAVDVTQTDLQEAHA